MYPGYSPADHEYGKAAEEFGKAAAEARAKGLELKHPEAEYEIGQAKGVKRKTLAEIREAHTTKGIANNNGSGSGTASGSEGYIEQKSQEPATTDGQASTGNVRGANSQGDNPYFVIDTKPTPVDLPAISFQSPKRSASAPEAVEVKKHKKAKKKHEGEMAIEEDGQEAKTEDISERVDARMKEKEERRKKKEEKKRKRESEGEPAAAVGEAQSASEAPATAAGSEKPKKKKGKKSEKEGLPDRTAVKKRHGEAEGEAEDGEGRKRKKRKKSQETGIVNDE